MHINTENPEKSPTITPSPSAITPQPLVRTPEMYSTTKFLVTNTLWGMWQRPHSSPSDVGAFINYLPYKNEWSVQFSNAQHDLALHQIYQLFSFCGRISNVVQRANHERTVYVNFESETEARRCVVGMMQQQSSIRLQPFPKNQSSMKNNQSPMNNFTPSNLGKVSPMKNASDAGPLSQTGSSVTSEEKNDKSTTQQNPLEILGKSARKSPEDTPEEFFAQFKGSKKSPVPQFLDTNPFKTLLEEAKGSGGAGAAGEEEEGREEGKSVEIQRRSRDQRLQAIIEAQEVVVANVPEGYGVFYVLHLLEKFEPICVSEMMTLGKHSLRYCHVYFKTPGDAEAAEADFDDVELAGRRLIVLRPHTMAEEAQRNAGEE